MPIEIRELVIQAKLEDSENPSDAVQRYIAEEPSEDSEFDIEDHLDIEALKREILDECLEMFREMQRQQEKR